MVLRGLACGVLGAGIIWLAIRGFKGLTGPNSLVRKRKMLGAFMMIAAVCGAIKPDGGTNSPSGGPPQQQQMMMVPRPLLMMPIGETVSELDVERGYRLDGATTNDASVYVAPSNAVYDTEWSAFGGATDSKTYDIGFDFPLGTNVYRKLNVTQNTSVRKRRRTDDVLLRVSESVSGMRRGVSAFSTWGDGARRIFNWTDCVGDPTTNLFNESAQLEVRPNGDFTVRSNELAFAYRRITPFDWDDDGLVNGIDPAPRTNGGDFYGQSDAWVLANFTNAEEILSVGYTNWVDGIVGDDPDNGVAKLTLVIPGESIEPLAVTAGGLKMVANRGGDYCFPVYSCEATDIILSRAVTNASVALQFTRSGELYSMSPPMLRAGGQLPSWRYTSGENVVYEIALFKHWRVELYHRIVASPGSWAPSNIPDVAHTVTFTVASLNVPDRDSETFAWTTSNPQIVTVAPNGPTASVTCRWDEDDWGSASIKVESTCGTSTATGVLTFPYGEEPEHDTNVCRSAYSSQVTTVAYEIPAGMRSYIAVYAATQEDQVRTADGRNDALFWQIAAQGYATRRGSTTSAALLPDQAAARADGRRLEGFPGVVFEDGAIYTAGATSLVVTVTMEAADGGDELCPSYLIAEEYPLNVSQSNMPVAGGIAGTTDIGGPAATFEERLPTNGLAYVTGEPAAAALTAEFERMPDWHEVVWGGRLTSERGDRHDIDNRTLTAATGTVYNITAALTNEVVGGMARLTATIDGRELPDYEISIRGKNPLDAAARAYITAHVDSDFADYAWMIAKHESKAGNRVYNQFNPSAGGYQGKPFKGNGLNWGWGIGQIDGEFMESSVVWNWHTNLERMNEVLRQKLERYRSYVNAYRNAYSTLPGGTPNPLWSEPPSTNINGVVVSAEMWGVCILYNGSDIAPRQIIPNYPIQPRSPLQFSPVDGRWIFHNNSNEYVISIINDSQNMEEE